MGMMKLAVLAAAALGFALAAGVAPASAGVVAIHPDQFVPDASASVSSRNPGGLSGTGAFYRVVRLPAGKRVVKLLVTYSNGGPFSFRASLLRKRVGELNDTVIDFYGDSPAPGGPVTVASSPGDVDGPALITSGNRWFVSLRLDSADGAIHDVRVVWR